MTIRENLRYLTIFGIKVTFAKTINKLFGNSGGYANSISIWNNNVIKNYLPSSVG